MTVEHEVVTVLEADRITVIIRLVGSSTPMSFSFPVHRSKRHPHAVKIDGQKLCDYLRSLVQTTVEVCDGRS